MIKIPVFQYYFTVEVIDGEGVLLISEKETYVICGLLFEKIAKAMDGCKTVDEILKSIAISKNHHQVYYALLMLEQKDLICEANNSVPRPISAFWASEGLNGNVAWERFSNAKIWVHSTGGVNDHYIKHAIAQEGIELAPHLENATLAIVVTDDYLNPELVSFNKKALELGFPWLLMRPQGREILIGPWFISEVTACYQCMRHRLRRHKLAEEFVRSKRCKDSSDIAIAFSALPATQHLAANLASTEVERFIRSGGSSKLVGEILSLDTLQWFTKYHVVGRLKSCITCGNPPKKATMPLPLILTHRRNLTFQDGGHRAVSSESTLNRYRHLISPITGIVSELILQRQGTAFVYTAGHSSSYEVLNITSLQNTLKIANSGKGMTEVQAKVSALCEALERFSGEYTGAEYYVRSRFIDAPFITIDPRDCMLYSDSQYQKRDYWNSKKSQFNWVPERFNPNEEVNWSPVWSLTASQFKYLPTQYLYYGAPLFENIYRRVTPCCSNGNAAGNTIEEAIIQGVLELVERDCVALWWYNRLIKQGVDLTSFNDECIIEFIRYYDSIDRDVWVIDITSDINIPCFAAISRLRTAEEERILIGFGCHLNAHAAIQRALAEMNQMLDNETVFKSSTANSFISYDNETEKWLKKATLANQPYIGIDVSLPLIRKSEYTGLETGDSLQDILVCRKKIESIGLEILVLNQTREDVGLPVVKVIIPGLRHFWARFAPGRLYDIPLKLGWLKLPLTEEELNPISIFF